jgi:small conductance mechanosensitive channel
MNETTAAEEVVETTKNAVEEMNQFTAYLQENIPNIIEFGVKVLFAILFFLVGRAVIKWIRKIVRHSMERSNADVGVRQFVDSVLKVVLYFILLFSIATKFGVDAASVAALIASGGVAIGLALQGSLSNFAGGVLILLLKPFEVGDYIIEDTNHNEGTVKEIQIFYTKLSTVDNKTIVIPNGMLTNNSLTNATAKAERKLDLKIDIAYEADLRKAKAVIEEIIRQDDATIKNEEILVFVHELAESSVVIGARAWVKNEDYWNARWRILEEIKLKLDENEIEMAYPHLTVQMGKEN